MNNKYNSSYFTYGTDGNRYRVDFKTSGVLKSNKVYIGNSEFGYSSTGVLIYARTIIKAPTGVCAVYQDSGGVKAFYYIHTDSQGSWLAITNSSGTVTNRYSYDAWGRARNVNDWLLKPIPITNALANLTLLQPRFDRGYTGHEMVYDFGLINMNGRLYDPYLQRFLSPDPYVQSPLNAQNYNRYSYCLNNPLMYKDPSGYSIYGGIFSTILSPFDILIYPIMGTVNWISGVKHPYSEAYHNNCSTYSAHLEFVDSKWNFHRSQNNSDNIYNISNGMIQDLSLTTGQGDENRWKVGELTNVSSENSLKQYIAIVCGESSDNSDEAAAIGSVMMNRVAVKGTAWTFDDNFASEIKASRQFDAYGGDIYNEVMDMSWNDIFSSDNEYASRINGAMQPLLTNHDFSDGSYYFNSTAQKDKQDNIGFNWRKYKAGIFEITLQIGKTTFFKNTDPNLTWQ